MKKISSIFYVLLLLGCSTVKKRSLVNIKKRNSYASNVNIKKISKLAYNITVKKIGVIINESSDTEKTKQILHGLFSSNQKIKDKYKGRFFIVKSKTDKGSIKNNIKKLILKSKVSVIVSWGDESFLKKIASLWKVYKKPTFFITNSKFNNKYIYTISPNLKNYGYKLVNALQNRKIKRIAILTPYKYKHSKFLNDIKSYFLENKIEIVFDELYTSQNFYSMNKACEQIFSIDNKSRASEYKKIFKFEKRKANSQGFILNKRLVFLNAKINYDAIFILDNFRMVKHFVKLFKYYNAKGISLIGTHEWRSAALLSEVEPLLEGAIFVDFIGDYNKSPLLSKTSKEENNGIKFFVNASKGLEYDHALMGFYTGLVSQIISSIPKNNKSIAKILLNLKMNDSFLGKRAAFTKNAFNWPTFLFEVQNNSLKMIK